MKPFVRTFLTLIATLSVALLGAGVAFASGPGGGTGNGNGSTGRNQVILDCGGTTYTVAVPSPDGANGAGQIVGQLGHGVPVSGTFTVVDTNNPAAFSETDTFGVPGHPNQQRTECTGTVFSIDALDFFGGQVPAGVNPTDTITGTIDAFVIIMIPPPVQ